MIIELKFFIFLERSNKKNSSKPSSKTEKDESELGHQGSNGCIGFFRLIIHF
jgi:hypothetical protein